MPALDPKDYLWKNLCLLMGSPEPTVDSVQAKTGVGRGTIQRIKEGETSVGTDKLRQIADAFHLETWQLLVPGLKTWDDHETLDSAARYDKLSGLALNIAEMFDTLPRDLITRTKAHHRVMTFLVDALDAPGATVEPKTQPTPEPVRSAKTGKQHG